MSMPETRRQCNYRLENSVADTVADLATRQGLSQSDLVTRAVLNYFYGYDLRERDAQEFVDFLRAEYGTGTKLRLDFGTGEVRIVGSVTTTSENLEAKVREVFNGVNREYRLMLTYNPDTPRAGYKRAELLLARSIGRKPSTFAIRIDELHAGMFDYIGTEHEQETDWPPLDL